MTFNQAAVEALFASVVDTAKQLGVFSRVNSHEPVTAPGLAVSCSVWVEEIRGVTSSGLAATSGVVVLIGRVYRAFTGGSGLDYDRIDPEVLTAAATLMGAYSGEFTLDGTVREIDLLGQFGTPLSALAGYVPYDGKQYRVMNVTIPVVINDMFIQEA